MLIQELEVVPVKKRAFDSLGCDGNFLVFRQSTHLFLQSQVKLAEFTLAWPFSMTEFISCTTTTESNSSESTDDPKLANASASLFWSRGTCYRVHSLNWCRVTCNLSMYLRNHSFFTSNISLTWFTTRRESYLASITLASRLLASSRLAIIASYSALLLVTFTVLTNCLITLPHMVLIRYRSLTLLHWRHHPWIGV